MQEECYRAIKINKDLEDNKRQIQEMEQRKMKVASIIQKCRPLVHPNVDMEKLQACLISAMELDPENKEIESLQKEAAEYIELQKQKEKQKLARQRELHRLNRLLRQAENLHKRELVF